MSVKIYNSKEERLAARRASYQINREKRIAQTRASQIKRKEQDPDIGSKQYKRRLKLDPRWNQRISLRDYGLTIEEYEMRWDTQGGVCRICGNPETDTLNGKPKNLAVDHDPKHSKKEIRDLLCATCNRGLGLFMDNPQLLKNAVDYLEEWGKIYG
jgi:hypothetical protein